MPNYRIDDDKITSIERTTFAQQGLKERHDLQQLLKSRINVVSPDTLVVAEEFGEWEDSRRRIDLLGKETWTGCLPCWVTPMTSTACSPCSQSSRVARS